MFMRKKKKAAIQWSKLIRELLPIGSVVVLHGGEKKLMIIGIRQTDADHQEREYDYCAVPYPEGRLGDEYQYLFNHADIAQVVFRGYEDEERTQFLDQLHDLYAENGYI